MIQQSENHHNSLKRYETEITIPKEFDKENWDVRVVIPNYTCSEVHVNEPDNTVVPNE